MTTAEDVEKLIRNDGFYGNLIIPVCFPAYFLGGEEGVRRQYMKPGTEDMDDENFAQMVAQCSQVMDVYQIILERSKS